MPAPGSTLSSSWLRAWTLVLAGVWLVALSGCSPRQRVIGGIADSLAAQGQAAETDLELAREASAFYLKLSEAVLREQPHHAGLAEATVAGFSQYAYAFVAFEADRVEATDVQAAQALRQRAARLYRRAYRHGRAALAHHAPGLFDPVPASGVPVQLDPAQVGLAYWTAAAWGGWIALSTDSPEVVADLPAAARLVRVAWNADPAWGDGSLTSLLATFEGARPGGQSRQAFAWHDQAIAQSAGRAAGPLVAKAESVALPAGDRPLFEALLRQALAIEPDADDPRALANEVMRRRAAWLLGQADDLF